MQRERQEPAGSQEVRKTEGCQQLAVKDTEVGRTFLRSEENPVTDTGGGSRRRTEGRCGTRITSSFLLGIKCETFAGNRTGLGSEKMAKITDAESVYLAE